MDGEQTRIDRRGFLRAGAAAAGALAFGDWSAARAAELPKRTLGGSGLEVTVISCGGCDQPRVIEAAVDRGVNLFHTSIHYREGRCIDALGEVMRRRRDEVYLALKEPPSYRQFEDCLRRLNTDHVDVVVPPIGPDTRPDARVIADFERAREQGKVRHLGYAAHDRMAENLTNRTDPAFTVCLCNYNIGNREELDPVIHAAVEQRQLGLMVMKASGGLRRNDQVEWRAGLRSLLSNPDIVTLTIGLRAAQELDSNLTAVLEQDARADWEFGRRAAAAARSMCSFCGDCARVCPRRLPLTDYLRARLYRDRGDRQMARELLASLPPDSALDTCSNCGACDAACPKRLPVRRWVREVARAH